MDPVIDYFILILQFHVSLCWDDVSINIRMPLSTLIILFYLFSSIVFQYLEEGE